MGNCIPLRTTINAERGTLIQQPRPEDVPPFPCVEQHIYAHAYEVHVAPL